MFAITYTEPPPFPLRPPPGKSTRSSRSSHRRVKKLLKPVELIKAAVIKGK